MTEFFFENNFSFFSNNNSNFKKNKFLFQIDVTRELEKLYNKKPANAKKPPRTFKLKRAQMNHLQTLREISQQRQEPETEKDKEEESDSEKGEMSSQSTSKTHTK